MSGSGSPILERWIAACKAAGLPGVLIHDLRRSAVRNMEQAGVPRSVATKLTGHKTEAVYRRYAIVSDADLAAAARRIEGRLPVTAGGSVTFRSRSAVQTAKGVAQVAERMVGRDGIEPPTPGFFRQVPERPLVAGSDRLRADAAARIAVFHRWPPAVTVSPREAYTSHQSAGSRSKRITIHDVHGLPAARSRGSSRGEWR